MTNPLTPCEWRVLKTLNQSEPFSIKEIAKQSGVSYPSLIGKGGIVQRFLNAGWVEKVENLENKKRKKIQITEEGKRYVREKKKIYDGYFSET